MTCLIQSAHHLESRCSNDKEKILQRHPDLQKGLYACAVFAGLPVLMVFAAFAVTVAVLFPFSLLFGWL